MKDKVIESPLNGGLCGGKFSVNDMKSKGWSVDDIKISQTPTGMNFIYILKNGTTIQTTSTVATGSQADMEARIMAKLEKKKVEEEKAKEFIYYIYKLSKLKKPEIIFLDSPLGCQFAVTYTSEVLKYLKKKKFLKNSRVSSLLKVHLT